MASSNISTSNSKTNSMERQNVNELRIILMGGVGKGKSSVGNSILGREFFEYDCQPDSLTSECSTGSCRKYLDDEMTQELKISVTDTPGVNEKRENNDAIIQLIGQQIFELTAPGPNCILIICRVDRFTEHEEETIELIKSMFGPNAVKYCIVVFTYVDQLKKGETIEKWIKKSSRVCSLLAQYQNRYIAINNKNVTEEKIKEVTQMIYQMIAENGKEYYTNSEYQRIERIRQFEKKQKAEEEELKRSESEKLRRETEALKQQLEDQRLKQENCEAKLKQQSRKEQLFYDIGTKLACGLIDVGAATAKSATDKYIKSENNPKKSSEPAPPMPKTQPVSEHPPSTSSSTSIISDSKSQKIEITSVQTSTSFGTEKPASSDSNHETRDTIEAVSWPTTSNKFNPVLSLFPYHSMLMKSDDLSSHLKLDPMTQSLLARYAQFKQS